MTGGGEAWTFFFSYTGTVCLVSRRSLNLVETLLRLSDSGHYQPVFEAFKVPMTKCPDVLVLALLQTSVSAVHLSPPHPPPPTPVSVPRSNICPDRREYWLVCFSSSSSPVCVAFFFFCFSFCKVILTGFESETCFPDAIEDGWKMRQMLDEVLSFLF